MDEIGHVYYQTYITSGPETSTFCGKYDVVYAQLKDHGRFKSKYAKLRGSVLTPEIIVGVAKVKTGFSIPGSSQTCKILRDQSLQEPTTKRK